jgi:hypothetical protein
MDGLALIAGGRLSASWNWTLAGWIYSGAIIFSRTLS